MKTEIHEAVTALSALAQESRLRVFRLLVKQGPGGMRAGTIAAELDIPPATLSFHLKELVHAGLIESRREGRSIIYGLNAPAVRGLMAFLTEDCCQGRPELCVPGDCGPGKKKGRPGAKRLPSERDKERMTQP
ncbi:MAG: ArsR/SmtB family transcription factor [Pirellulaceae bacterium]